MGTVPRFPVFICSFWCIWDAGRQHGQSLGRAGTWTPPEPRKDGWGCAPTISDLCCGRPDGASCR